MVKVKRELMRDLRLSFGRKVLLLAVALVTVVQLGTLVPVLSTIRNDTEQSADRTVRLAGIVFDEFMRNRLAQLETTVDVLVADFPFRNALATGDAATIESVLSNHAARAGTDTALVFDLEGNVLASAGMFPDPNFSPTSLRGPAPADLDVAINGITFLNGAPYQTITVPVRAPVTIAWVMLGFPIDDDLVAGLARLTGLEVSIVSFGMSGIRTYTSTLDESARALALNDVRLGEESLDEPAHMNGAFITRLRPFSVDDGGVYAALQLPTERVVASYERIRNGLVFVSAMALALAIAGAAWLSGMVSRPVRNLVEAATRMREGIYSESIDIDSQDEFGDLAAGFNAMQKAIANREKDIFFIAHHDSLSGLPTRDVIVGKLRDLIGEDKAVAVINMALYRFHDIASTLGHGTADQVIRRVAELLRAIAGEQLLLGHLSQHEFVLIAPGCESEGAVSLIENIREMLRAGIALPNANISLQISAGIALCPEHRQDAPELLRCAASARMGSRRYSQGIGIYDPAQDEKARRLVRIVGDFPAALQNHELEVVYQPRIDVATQALAGAEALVRWNHATLGLLQPGEFVTAIERAGGIAHLSRFVLSEAVTQCAIWQSQGILVPMSVNISVDDLEDEYLPHFLLELVVKRQVTPQQITLEVTESAIMHNIEASLSVITCMRDLGFRLAIDDFGTGQASLTQLKRIPADELKIDKSFVQNFAHPHDDAIVRATIELAHQFGLDAVAEGVENLASFDRLRALGCEYAQGYYFAKPLAPAAFVAWLHDWQESSEADLVQLVSAGG